MVDEETAMNAFDAIFAFLSGTLLRFGVPIALTILMIYLLRKLDARWQAEAERHPAQFAADQVKCWETKGCPPELRIACQGFLHSTEQPCWQTFRAENGYLKEICLDCNVFRNAPIPQYSPTH
jgi:hypothetical protein